MYLIVLKYNQPTFM